jgi:hypothetical protein
VKPAAQRSKHTLVAAFAEGKQSDVPTDLPTLFGVVFGEIFKNIPKNIFMVFWSSSFRETAKNAIKQSKEKQQD